MVEDIVYFYEKIINPHGVSVDYTGDMCGVEYYCRLGYDVSHGSYCKDYEWHYKKLNNGPSQLFKLSKPFYMLNK